MNRFHRWNDISQDETTGVHRHEPSDFFMTKGPNIKAHFNPEERIPFRFEEDSRAWNVVDNVDWEPLDTPGDKR
ncbi:hypothetical protein N7462_001080 [Penicillium macrosclerotiorum]|uniref:uncharacterized protein n=1 Tax=Penicillium macrosclerotiorum TaxID=303699 RepID=UPI0025490FDF|nr:uncharacterized protein N7462_001080 [Penicillium macrosclerotiorum]KAJ5699075.1 hypothetical protein N7462_001080 [Penicillium macrosclerotiorum]